MTFVNTHILKQDPLNIGLAKSQGFKVALVPVIAAPMAPVAVELWVLLSGALSQNNSFSGHSVNTYPKSKIHFFDSKIDAFEKSLLAYFDTVSPVKASNKDILFLAKWIQTTDHKTYSASVVILAKNYFAKIAAAHKLMDLKNGSRSKLEKTTDDAIGSAIKTLLENPNLSPKQRSEASKLYIMATEGVDPAPDKKGKKQKQSNATSGATPPDPGKKPDKNKDKGNKIKQQNEAQLKELKAKLKAEGKTGDAAYVDALKKAAKALRQLNNLPKGLKLEEQLVKVSQLMAELDAANFTIKIFESFRK